MIPNEKKLQQLRKLLFNSPVKVAPATVVSVEPDTCTVQFSGSDLILSGITPLVMEDNTQRFIAIPRPGASVLVMAGGEKPSLDRLGIIWITEPADLALMAGDHLITLTEGRLAAEGASGKRELTPELLTSLLAD